MTARTDEICLLMIGNNPIELTRIMDHIKNMRGRKVITEIAFDLRSGLARLAKFNPNFIILDDNLGRIELTNAIGSLSHLRKTKHIPVTVIKNSNYHEAFGGVAMNYVLKENLSGESLHRAFRSSLISTRAQMYMKKVYRKRKGQLMRLLPTTKFR
jgi:DNA-binding NarL/FixJ family response regulator